MAGIALVTGASRGIGRAIAARLARDGYSIWANYASNREAAEELCTELGSAIPVKFDVADAQDVHSALEPLIELHGAPEVIVSNAGVTKDGLMAMMSAEEWQRVIDTNLGGFFHVVKACLRPMLKRRSGRIVAISSVSGQAGNPGQVNYSASKAGLIGACKSLAKEIASRNITVNVVAPGFVETDMVKDLPRAELEKMIPLRRFGKADEIAAAVSFFASEEAAYITGQVLGVNGGLYM